MIEQAYLPTTAEVEHGARDGREAQAARVGTLADGEFVDAAMLGAAQQVLALAARYGTSGSTS